ncbi:hypothetical protein ACTXG7_12715 [Mycolicibacterium sp. Dal123E01]|uniref:hypothetical protein n=1 Tax=Mycolicibacterium sp. Dal123E01 TaxID=3457578 RepID=UPI00403E4F16
MTVVVVDESDGAGSAATGVAVIADSVSAAASGTALLATGDRAGLTDRTDTEEPLLESSADGLSAGRVRAGPAVLFDLVELEGWLELLPPLPDPLSGDAAATPWPTPTAKPSPIAAAKMPFRAARLPVEAGCFRWRAASFRWRPTRFLELTKSPDATDR